MFVATDNLLPDAAAAECLRKKFFGAKFVRRDLFSETFLFPSSPFAAVLRAEKLLPGS